MAKCVASSWTLVACLVCRSLKATTKLVWIKGKVGKIKTKTGMRLFYVWSFFKSNSFDVFSDFFSSCFLTIDGFWPLCWFFHFLIQAHCWHRQRMSPRIMTKTKSWPAVRVMKCFPSSAVKTETVKMLVKPINGGRPTWHLIKVALWVTRSCTFSGFVPHL